MKSSCYPLLLGLAVLAARPTAAGVIITEPTRNFSVGYTLADYQNPPQDFLQTIRDSAILSLTRVEVGLHLVGVEPGSGFASEMFVSLNKDLSLISVLLNRVGVTGSDPTGQGYDGWNVSFGDEAANGDIHGATLTAGTLSGLWEPDGRADPTDTDRSLLLGVFNGSTGNGDWRLSVADLDLGGTMRLESWSLTLTGETVATAIPEPETYAAGLAMLALTGLNWWRSTARRKEEVGG